MHTKIAVETFLSGHNCAQAIVSAFGPELGLNKEHALKLATGLGAGINYSGKTCGAVMGAHIVLGLKYGTDSPTDLEAKQRLRSLLDSFCAEFRNEYGSTECNHLLKADINDPDQLQKLRNENVFHTFCVKVVERAAALTDKIIAQYK